MWFSSDDIHNTYILFAIYTVADDDDDDDDYVVVEELVWFGDGVVWCGGGVTTSSHFALKLSNPVQWGIARKWNHTIY